MSDKALKPFTMLAAALRGLAVISCLVLIGITSAASEPVSVNGSAGQGFAVAHRNNCYVFLPQHVHGTASELSLSTGAPPVVGQGRVFQTFAPEIDLSVAFVTGGLEGRCDDELKDLPRNVDPFIAPGGEVNIVTVAKSGRIQRVKARVTMISYDELQLEIVDEAPHTDMFQGRSGGVVLSGDTPVGMVVEAAGTRQATALRIDAILDRVTRLISGGGGSSPAPPVPTEAPREAAVGLFGLAGEIGSCSAEPVRPDASCWNLQDGSGPLLVPADAVPFTMVLRLDGEAAVPVRQVRLQAYPKDGASTAPKSVIIERAAGTLERPRWLSFAQADTLPDGSLQVQHGAAPRTRALRLTFLDSWEANLPIRIDRIEVR